MASTQLPDRFQADYSRLWESWLAVTHAAPVNLTAEVLAQLPYVWICSDFVAQACLREPQLLAEFQANNSLFQQYSPSAYMQSLSEQLAGIKDEADLKSRLRRYRRREMVRILWRDLAGSADLAETLRDLSGLADACIEQALQWQYRWQTEAMGTPLNQQGEPQQLVVLGMGKLGGGELNVSSDVDLIFAYPDAGQTHGAARQYDNHEFFLRLGQKLIQTLDQVTEDGFVFRVDTRLRPFGDSGPLVMSFDGMENYYATHGREWERYALIKARVVAGAHDAGQELLARLKPFVYRRYLDYNAYESLRELKGMIEKEVTRKGIEHNVKLGAGGIREIEFIGQVFQLIRGGRDKAFQSRSLFPVLDYLQKTGLLPEFVVSQLKQAYRFLRNTEHRIQGYADQQSHNLPQDDSAQARLAYAMGFLDWKDFYQELLRHRTRVHTHFEQVFESPQSAQNNSQINEQVLLLWSATTLQDTDAAQAIITELGFHDTAMLQHRLLGLKTSRAYLSASARGQTRLDRILPLLIGAALQQTTPDLALQRSLEVIEAILRRTAYLALLEEHPLALSQLVQLCAASPWITNYLTTHPILLDELLDPRNLYNPPSRAVLDQLLSERVENIEPHDEEQQLDNLRQFKHAQVLRVAAADIAEVLPLMKVSDHLTWIAEAILNKALTLAWRHLVSKHGCPPNTDTDGHRMGFAMVGYGKLAGLELGYGSDLDLVFIYEDGHGHTETQGERPLAVPVFYARLTQRLIHILTTLTPAGILYDVDMRLRPDGAAGLLVTTTQAFAEYQAHKAWTWEHQALVRARVVAGDEQLTQVFTTIRASVLGRQRDPSGLRIEVVEMRQKMRSALDKAPTGQFDLKHSPGGIVDIEFMVQYAILAWAHTFPDLLTYPDNIRQLEGLASHQILSTAKVAFLSEAYRTYRGWVHRKKLQELPAQISAVEAAPWSEGVQRIWTELMVNT